MATGSKTLIDVTIQLGTPQRRRTRRQTKSISLQELVVKAVSLLIILCFMLIILPANFRMGLMEWSVMGLIIVMIILFIVVQIKRRLTWIQLERLSGIAEIDRMSGAKFEKRMEAYFQTLEYQVESVPAKDSHGVDFILQRGDKKIVVQTTRQKDKVGVSAIRNILSGRAHYDADQAVVVTNNQFSQPAIRLAVTSGVELWDRSVLVVNLAAQTASASQR